MRPLKFPTLATGNAGLMNAGAQGMNSAIQNFQRARMQRAQMQFMQQRGQALQQQGAAMANFRNSEAMRQQAMAQQTARNAHGADLDAIKYGQLAIAGKQVPPELADTINKKNYQAAVDSFKDMAPQDRQAAMDQLQKNIGNHVVDPNTGGQALNYNDPTAKLAGIMSTGQSRENAAKTMADAGITKTNINAGARGDAIKQKDIANQRTTLTSQINKLQESITNLDKPPLPGTPPVDPGAKANIKAGYMAKQLDLHQQLDSLGQDSGSSGQPQPKVYIPNQSGQVQPGFRAGVDYVQHPNGGLVLITGNHPDGTPALNATGGQPIIQSANAGYSKVTAPPMPAQPFQNGAGQIAPSQTTTPAPQGQ